jgi:phosphatidylserine decarboxylase precursor
VVSPADGTIVEAGLATAGKLIQAKGSEFDLASLLGDPEAAARLQGGAYLITYLSPKDYHRVHSPVAGRVVGWRHVPGTLFSVNAGNIRREPGLFVETALRDLIGRGGLSGSVMWWPARWGRSTSRRRTTRSRDARSRSCARA